MDSKKIITLAGPILLPILVTITCILVTISPQVSHVSEKDTGYLPFELDFAPEGVNTIDTLENRQIVQLIPLFSPPDPSPVIWYLSPSGMLPNKAFPTPAPETQELTSSIPLLPSPAYILPALPVPAPSPMEPLPALFVQSPPAQTDFPKPDLTPVSITISPTPSPTPANILKKNTSHSYKTEDDKDKKDDRDDKISRKDEDNKDDRDDDDRDDDGDEEDDKLD